MRHILALLPLLCIAAVRPDAADPYLWLEQVHGARALDWVRAENARSLKPLQSDPHYRPFFDQALAIAQATDRIPKPEMIGRDIYNLWQDGTHVQGLWRHTTPADFARAAPQWQTAIDLDALSRAEHHIWVWEGATCARPRSTRCLVALSEGGEDAVTTREFDLPTARFVPGGFTLPHAKQVADWEDADSILLGTDWGLAACGAGARTQVRGPDGSAGPSVPVLRGAGGWPCSERQFARGCDGAGVGDDLPDHQADALRFFGRHAMRPVLAMPYRSCGRPMHSREGVW